MATEKVINQLNSFLRGEIAARQSYQQALDKIKNVDVRSYLEECRTEHEERVLMLKGYIERVGGAPSEAGGVWGSFAQLLQAGANIFGEKAAVIALEQGEDVVLGDYRRDLNELDEDAVRFVAQEILPSQEKTHARVSALKERLS
jgi:uncharacterized protein (TIGR02284 family)